MRYYDISGRVAVFNLAHSVACTTNDTTVLAAGSAQSAVADAMKYVDRTGYYSYIVQVILQDNMSAGSQTLSLSVLLESSTPTAATAAGWTAGKSAVTSVSSADANYKQLYLNSTGSITSVSDKKNFISAGFQDQPYVWTSYGDIHLTPVVMDARIFGSLRDAKVTGKYIAPVVTVVATDAGTRTITCDVNLILGGGDRMPVFEAGTSGTNTYYSDGQ
jgi:hypothetical protein